MLAYGEWLEENLPAPVPHRQHVFTLPKLIRPFFRYRRHSGFSVHNCVRSKGNDAEGRQRLARYMIRCPFALNKMSFDQNSGTVIYRSKLHATLKRNYQLMPAVTWLRLLLNHVPDKYEHLVRYYGYYSNRSRGARRLAEQKHDTSASIVAEEAAVDARRKVNWACLVQKVYAVDPLKCLNCGATMRIIALIYGPVYMGISLSDECPELAESGPSTTGNYARISVRFTL